MKEKIDKMRNSVRTRFRYYIKLKPEVAVSSALFTSLNYTMPRTNKKDRSGHMQEETTAKHKLNLDNDEPGTDNSPTSSPLRGLQ